MSTHKTYASGWPFSQNAIRVTISLLFLVLAAGARGQGVFESAASGAFSSSSTWVLVSGADSDNVPDANDDVTIKPGHTVTSGAQNRDCANLTVEAGGILSINGNGNVRINASTGVATISGSVVMSSSGRLIETGTGTRTLIIGDGGSLTISGNAANPQFDVYTFHPNSTVGYTRTASQTILSGVKYGHLTLAGSGTKTVGPLPPDTTFEMDGKLTVAAGVTMDVSTNILYIHLNGDVENNGTINASVGTTVLRMRGASWVNNGTFLPSLTPGFGQQPVITFEGTTIGGSTPTQRFFDLRFEGTCQLSIGIDSARHVTIANGATLSGGWGTSHRISGIWSVDGYFACQTSTITFSGTTTQSIGGSTFSNLIINNPSGVSLSGDLTIAQSGSLRVLNGTVNTNGYTVHILNPDTASLILGANIITGTVARSIAPGVGGRYYFFNVNTYVAPNGTGNPTVVVGTVYPNSNPPGLPPNADTNTIVRRYYTFSQTGAGSGFFFALRLAYDQSEVRGNEANYALWRNPGESWVNMGAVIVDPVNNFVEQVALSSFSTWAIAEENAALPITLSYFNAIHPPGTDRVHLTWQTLTEIDNYGFIVQRSSQSGAGFSDIPGSFVPGNGTTLVPHDYEWTHNGATSGTHFYRLKQIDFDGTLHFTDAVEVVVGMPTSVAPHSVPAIFNLDQNYPNPFNPSTTIRFTVENTDVATVAVYNMIGQQVAILYSAVTDVGRVHEVRFNAVDLPNGTYLYKLTTPTGSAVRKMMLLK